jgi:hypothetical protein
MIGVDVVVAGRLGDKKPKAERTKSTRSVATNLYRSTTP